MDKLSFDLLISYTLYFFEASYLNLTYTFFSNSRLTRFQLEVWKKMFESNFEL